MGSVETRIERLNLADLKPQQVNARYMPHEQFTALVRNLRRDGALTSVPLVYRNPDGDNEIVSGHHRVMAALEAGITEADCMVITQELTRQQLVAMQLSHNAITGVDDPATLKRLYDELDDIDWRDYSGLDDKTLDMLEKVDVGSLSEANLDFSTILLVFLPHELDAAREALKAAAEISNHDDLWLAAMRDYEPTLAALETTHQAHSVGNVATALNLIIGVFERHLTDLQDGWLRDGEPRHTKPVPMETVFGTRHVPAPTAAVIANTVNGAEDPWAVIADLCKQHQQEGDDGSDT